MQYESRVTPQLFALLGVAPALGRVFTSDDTASGVAAPVVVISDRLWRRHFDADPAIVGRDVRLDRHQVTIVGVMPAGFQYPSHRPDFWSPLPVNPADLDGATRLVDVTARLKPGVSIGQAQVDLDAVAARLGQETPGVPGADAAFVWPLRDVWFGWTRGRLRTPSLAAGLLLLMACANIAALLLARGAARGPELAVRMALGAGRERIVRQLLTESALLAAGGGVLGLVVAWIGTRALGLLDVPPGGTTLGPLTLDLPLAGVALALSAATGLLFGLAPAIAVPRGRMRRPSEPARPARGVAGSHRWHERLVAAQLAIAVMLLAGFGLLTHSLVRLAGRDLHFDPAGVLTFDYRIPAAEYTHPRGTYRGLPLVAVDPAPTAMLTQVHGRLRELPGVQAVAGISAPPIGSLVISAVTVVTDGIPDAAPAARDGVWSQERAQDRDTFSTAAYFLVTPAYFSTIGATLVRGREIETRDTAGSPWVVVINETAARRFWPGRDPIGQRLTLDTSPVETPRVVVGVVRDMPLRFRLAEPAPVVYASYQQQPAPVHGHVAGMMGRLVVVMRHAAGAANVLPEVRRAVAEIDPARPIGPLTTVTQYLDARIQPSIHYALGIGVFALTAAGLAGVGLYGVMAYVVARRTREIGIRRALGAGVRDVVALVGGRALRVVAAGVTAGLLVAPAVGHAIAAQLWDVRPFDPLTFVGVSLFLAAVVLLACVVPVRRALAVDPSVTLRVE